MHRNCRVVSVLRNQCGCRQLATAAATQLKPKPNDATNDSLSMPRPRAWNLPSHTQSPVALDLPKSKDKSRPASPSRLATPTHSQGLHARRHITPEEWQRPSSVYMQSSKTAGAPNNAQVSNATPSPKNWSRPLSPSTTTDKSNTFENESNSTSLERKSRSFESFPTKTASRQVGFKDEVAVPNKWTTSPNTILAPSLTTPDSANPDTITTPMKRETPNTPRKSELAKQITVEPRTVQTNRLSDETKANPRFTQRPGTQAHSPRTIPKNKEDYKTLKSRQSKTQSTRKRGRRRDVYIPSTLTVATLASILKLKLEYLLSRMKKMGMLEEASYDYILNADYAALLADELGFNPIIDDEVAFDIHPPPPHPNLSSQPFRPPIVTIMGHVDHGKTTLLDTLRSASVAKGEAGGITQHIGAFSVPVKCGQGAQTITFLDTPGHAAFSAMRARGADVTDIVVLVVAADDGIMPQTKEVINLLKKEDGQSNLVVAINKVDKPGVNTDAVKKALMAEGIQLEEFGGDIPAVSVSGLTGQGLPELVETISALAEMQDLRAEHDGPVFGHVLESNVHKGLGSVATVLVRRGCLKRGSQIISGLSHGKIRLMTDSKGVSVQKALPGMAVTVSGWKTLPKAGDEVLEGSDADIKKALANRTRKAVEDSMQQDIEVINAARRMERDARAAEANNSTAVLTPDVPSGPKQVKIVIKADVSGSGEALEGALDGMGNHIVVSKVISTGVGDVSESDVMRAQAANATIVAFSVSVPRTIRTLANQLGVPILSSDIIYRLMDDIRTALIALLPPIIETKVLGEADILQVFDIQLKGGKTMKVAGCRVTNGIVEKTKSARVVRAGEVIHEGVLDTFRQLKKDIVEARKGVECGMSLKDFSDVQAGDIIQMYDTIEKPGVL